MVLHDLGHGAAVGLMNACSAVTCAQIRRVEWRSDLRWPLDAHLARAFNSSLRARRPSRLGPLSRVSHDAGDMSNTAREAPNFDAASDEGRTICRRASPSIQ